MIWSWGLSIPPISGEMVCLLGQGARLFHGTLRENLTLGAPTANDEAIFQTLDAMRLSDFVQALPKGLDHLVQGGRFGPIGGTKAGFAFGATFVASSQGPFTG